MHSYVLYGLDESGRVLDADEIGASSLEKARKIAGRLARHYPKAELWDGMLCESRFARQPAPVRDPQPRPARGLFDLQRLRRALLG